MADTNETIADIIAEMRGMGNYQRYSGDHARVLADRLEAALRRERGDSAKLREALEKCANWGEQIDCQLGSSDETVYAFRDERCLAHNISECARAALSAPPRNCDLPKVVEDPWRAWLDDKSNWDEFGSPKLEIHDWLVAPATEKKGGGR